MMAAPEPTPELLLDYLYGLLDPAEAEQLRPYLATPAGQAALRRAERARDLFAAAAKSEFPGVRFEPPAAAPAAVVNGQRRGWRLVGWCVAAAVVLAVGVPAGAHVVTTVRQHRDLAAAERRLSDVQRAYSQVMQAQQGKVQEANVLLQQAQEQWQARQTELNAKLQKAQEELQAKQ